jgi:hypothetical protein
MGFLGIAATFLLVRHSQMMRVLRFLLLPRKRLYLNNLPLLV